jgi:hypothetical protein
MQQTAGNGWRGKTRDNGDHTAPEPFMLVFHHVLAALYGVHYIGGLFPRLSPTRGRLVVVVVAEGGEWGGKGGGGESKSEGKHIHTTCKRVGAQKGLPGCRAACALVPYLVNNVVGADPKQVQLHESILKFEV